MSVNMKVTRPEGSGGVLGMAAGHVWRMWRKGRDKAPLFSGVHKAAALDFLRDEFVELGRQFDIHGGRLLPGAVVVKVRER